MIVASPTVQRTIGVGEAQAALSGREFVVPASIANLGPGFDALAVAVQLYVRVRVASIDPDSRNHVVSRFGGVELVDDDYVARSIRTQGGLEGVDFPTLILDVESDIPMQAGLGSSAAATVAGLRVYDTLAGHAGRDLVALGTGFEGHPWHWAGGMDLRGGPGSRWNLDKDLSFVPLRPERVVEVRYDHMEGSRFRHPPQFVRWRPDREPESCGYAQLEVPVRFDLADVLRGEVTPSG